MKVANYTEIIVTAQMDNILKDSNVCLCEICKSDIAAIALNNLAPCYCATEKGFLFSKLKTLQAQEMTDIVTQVTKAAAIVKEKPRH